MNRGAVIGIVFFTFLVFGCASVATHTPLKESKNDSAVKKAQFNGPKKRLQVVQFDIPQKTLAAYPELADKKIGYGLCNRLVDAFYDAGAFQFVEEKEQIIEKVLKNWAMSQSGAVNDSTRIEPQGLTAPQYLVYAEVFDFSVSTSETVVAVAAQQNKITRIGIQIRLVDVKTGEYIPSSGTGEVTVQKNAIIWAADQKSFDQSTVGQASQLAINTAVNTLLKRIQL